MQTLANILLILMIVTGIGALILFGYAAFQALRIWFFPPTPMD